MLLIYMYHRVTHTRFANDIAAFTEHLHYLAANYPIVLPGDPLPTKQLAICLTFDDAYYDFYHYVFPLLKKINIRVVLATPIKYILPSTQIAPKTRLEIPSRQAMTDNLYQTHAPFCTWQEIAEMSQSGLVEIASHTHNHIDLTESNTDLNLEISLSKQFLKNKLHQPINTFVYPMGKMTRQLHERVRKDYQYDMRIGSALNKNWDGQNGLLYRIDAEQFWPDNKKWHLLHNSKYYLKYLTNRLRHK